LVFDLVVTRYWFMQTVAGSRFIFLLLKTNFSGRADQEKPNPKRKEFPGWPLTRQLFF